MCGAVWCCVVQVNMESLHVGPLSNEMFKSFIMQ
jgi:hypothetical protein